MTRFGDVAITVQDMDRSVGFDRDQDAATAVGVPDTVGGFKHLALLTDDVDGVAARLRAAGIVFTLEPLDAVGGVRLAFFRDPDGNLLELVSGTPDVAPFLPGWPE